MKSARFTGLLLIFLGIILLLDQLEIFYPSTTEAFIFLSFVIGFLFMRRGLIHEHRRGIFPGTFLLALAVSFFSIEMNILADANPVHVGVVILSLSLAFFVSFIFRPSRSFHLYLGVLTSTTGVLIFLTYFRYISVWKLEYLLETYWPLALVLLGVVILSNKLFLKAKNAH